MAPRDNPFITGGLRERVEHVAAIIGPNRMNGRASPRASSSRSAAQAPPVPRNLHEQPVQVLASTDSRDASAPAVEHGEPAREQLEERGPVPARALVLDDGVAVRCQHSLRVGAEVRVIGRMGDSHLLECAGPGPAWLGDRELRQTLHPSSLRSLAGGAAALLSLSSTSPFNRSE